MSSSVQEIAGRLADGMERIVVGADRLTLGLTIALLARGHVLIEGVPGTGKTLAVRALALLLGLEFRRIAFTPDLMPSDVVGTTVFNPQTAQFTTRTGPIFANVVLADEVNRTPPKTQVGAARSDGRGARYDRRGPVSAAAAVPALRDAEPDRIRRNVSAAGSAARPFHDQSSSRRIRKETRRARAARANGRRFRCARFGNVGRVAGDERRRRARGAERGANSASLRRRARLRVSHRGGDALESASHARRVAARRRARCSSRHRLPPRSRGAISRRPTT